MNKTLHNLLRPILALTLCACMLLGFTGCGAGDELRTVTVCAVPHSVFYAPQYVAMNKGFFEEEGLKVELTNGGGTDKVMTAVLAGQAQIGLIDVYKRQVYPRERKCVIDETGEAGGDPRLFWSTGEGL